MALEWKDYQEEAARFFRGLGLDAMTDQTLQGVRTKHDIDVVVRSQHVGFDILWLVECKHWKTRISKLHVLALRQIVADLGADRGILLSEAGFQSGALEAADLTNICATSLEEFQISASDQISSMRIRDLFDRIEVCKQRYWDIPKVDRIAHGLRPEGTAYGYSGTIVIDLVFELLGKGLRGTYPIMCDNLAALAYGLPTQLNSSQEFLRVVDPLVSELEAKLARFEDRR